MVLIIFQRRLGVFKVVWLSTPILSNVNLKTNWFQMRSKSTFIPLKKTTRNKTFCSFCVSKKIIVTNFMTWIQNPSIVDLLCPWNLPILNLNIKLSTITVVQHLHQPFVSSDLPIYRVEEKWAHFFTGLSPKSWLQMYLSKWKQKNHKWKQQRFFASGPAWEGLSVGIIAINYFDF